MRRPALLVLLALVAATAWWLWRDGAPDRASPTRAGVAPGGTKSVTPPVEAAPSARERAAGRIVDATTDTPIADAVIEVVRFDVLARLEMGLDVATVVGRTQADADGRFELATVWDPEGTALLVHAPGYAWNDDAAPGPEFIRLGLETENATVRGRVVGPDGAPVPDVRVAILASVTPRLLRADREGRFEVAGVPYGAAEIVASAPGFVAASAPAEIDSDRPPPLALRLARGTVLAGTVRDAATGAPLEGVRVRASTWPGPTARTDARGRYVVSGVDLADGGERVAFERAGYRRLVRDLELEAAPEKARLDAHLEAGAVLTGTVVDPAGRPVPDAVVIPLNLDVIAHSFTDASGRFGVDHLTDDPARTMELRIFGGPYLETHTDPLPYGEVGTIELLVACGDRVSVSGRVEPPTRERATVNATAPVRRGRAELAWTRCDESGGFALRVPPGRPVRLRAAADGLTVVREIDVPETDHVLVEPLVMALAPHRQAKVPVRLAEEGWAALYVRRPGERTWTHVQWFRSSADVVLATGTYQAVAIGDGFWSGVVGFTLAHRVPDIELPVLPGDGRLEVSVRTPEGRSVSGVRAAVVAARNTPFLADGVTNGSGPAELRGFPVVEDLPYRLLLADEDRRVRAVVPFTPPRPRIDATWRALRTLAVRVLGPDGRPLARADVRAKDAFAWRRPAPRPPGEGNDLTYVGLEGLTDTTGTVRFRDLVAGPCLVRATHPVHGRAEAEADLSANDGVVELRFR